MPNQKGQGRKPKPRHLKLLEGEPNKSRINENEPQFYPKAPDPPSFLSAEARKEWRRLAPQLEKLGILTEADLAMFTGYCAAFGKLAWAEREIKKIRRQELKAIKDAGGKESLTPTMGGMITGGKGKTYSTLPYVWIFNKSLEQIRSFGSEFGLSPSSRTKIKVPDNDDPHEDLFT